MINLNPDQLATIQSKKGFSYTLTQEDVLWAARSACYEAGDDAVDILWCYTQRYVYISKSTRDTYYPNLFKLIRAHSQPVNPKYLRNGKFCKVGGRDHGTNACSASRLKTRDEACSATWEFLQKRNPEVIKKVTLWAQGLLPNSCSRAVDFANPGVSRNILKKNPQTTKLLKKAGNWFIMIKPSQSWDDDFVFMVTPEGSSTEDALNLTDRYIHGISSFAFPISSEVLPEWSKDLEGELFSGTEQGFPGGFYPLGENSLWHGGIHLKVPVGSTILAPFEGTIVAARLAEQDTNHYGSANFILMKHAITGFDLALTQPNSEKPGWIDKSILYHFYSLYMHLSPESLDISNNNIKNVAWIKNLTEPIELIGSVGKNGTNYRDDVRLVQNLLKRCNCYDGIVDNFCGPKTEEALLAFQSNPDQSIEPGDPAWKKLVDDYMNTNELRERIVSQLKSGDVTPLNINVATGDALWTSGEYFDDAKQEGILHWEIFSEENLFPEWTTVEDSEDGYHLNCPSILSEATHLDETFTTGEPLDREDVLNFYKNNPAAEKVRQYVCKFHNEWAINPDTSLKKIESVFDIDGLAEQIIPYLWWESAQQKNVALPSSPKVYHYNPIAFLSALESAFKPQSEEEADYSDTDFITEILQRPKSEPISEDQLVAIETEHGINEPLEDE